MSIHLGRRLFDETFGSWSNTWFMLPMWDEHMNWQLLVHCYLYFCARTCNYGGIFLLANSVIPNNCRVKFFFSIQGSIQGFQYRVKYEFNADIWTWSILLRCQFLYGKLEKRHCPNVELIFTYKRQRNVETISNRKICILRTSTCRLLWLILIFTMNYFRL